MPRSTIASISSVVAPVGKTKTNQQGVFGKFYDYLALIWLVISHFQRVYTKCFFFASKLFYVPGGSSDLPGMTNHGRDMADPLFIWVIEMSDQLLDDTTSATEKRNTTIQLKKNMDYADIIPLIGRSARCSPTSCRWKLLNLPMTRSRTPPGS
jgi:hypothetical protein